MNGTTNNRIQPIFQITFSPWQQLLVLYLLVDRTPAVQSFMLPRGVGSKLFQSSTVMRSRSSSSSNGKKDPSKEWNTVISQAVSQAPSTSSETEATNTEQVQVQQTTDSMLLLQSENLLLRETIRKLEEENLVLKNKSATLLMATTKQQLQPTTTRIVLENFEGERFFWEPKPEVTIVGPKPKPKVAATHSQQQSPSMDSNNKNSTNLVDDDGDWLIGEFGMASSEVSPSSTFSSSSSSGLTLTGEAIASNTASEELWCDILEQQPDDDQKDGSGGSINSQQQCPVEPILSFQDALLDRAYWLVGLLILQSLSGIILSRNEALLVHHPTIVYFLTMLVGAGGNAGNQASVRVIRGLALGTLHDRKTRNQFLVREFKMAFGLSAILSVVGFLRAIIFHTPIAEAVTITIALLFIVFSSICLGAILPILLEIIGVDPAHSSTTIQVLMDILGVVLAVVVSRAILDGPIGVLLFSKFEGLIHSE